MSSTYSREALEKKQLATDENKMLGNEEIRNTKKLDLMKSMIKAMLKKCFPLNGTSGEDFL